MKITSSLENILNKLVKNSARPILVGGFVRDSLLDIESKDIDVEVYGLDTLNQLSKLLEEFGSVNFVGKSFGVLKLKFEDKEYDFSFPRTENKIALGHKGFDVKVDGFLSYKDAAIRRDFTINSIGYDFKTKEFIDPFNGIQDLKKKILKHIDERTFIEDPLRFYRGIQFCARFNLKLHSKTKSLFKSIKDKDEFKTLPKERIFEEYKKLLLKSNKPSIGLKLLAELGVYKLNENILYQVDELAKIKTNDEKTDLVLFFFLLEDLLKNILNDQSLLKDMEKLKAFKVPKIFQNQIDKNDTNVMILKKKYFMLKNMPKPLLMGKDLINMGLEPNKEFKTLLDKVYDEQLSGNILTLKGAKEFLKTLL